ncbi:unnamed protein product [Brachionus calyciflorus]|uniref:MULE transposase domain-containing protein n=1 Tax=Brachionus calyciflorus TaxID=104777 RepID=A0A813SRR5_9BILA|nr:unnamed protein product [Brachionus calyciflorus]
MTIKSNTILRYQNNHSHRDTAYQELKQEISSDLTKSIKTAYNDTQRILIKENIPDRAVAALFPRFSTVNNTLYKIKATKRPPIPSDFSKLTITGDYLITTKKQPFLRYDNRSSTSIIIIFVDNECLKYLADAKEWFIDRTFKASPDQFLQLYTLHAHIYNTTLASRQPSIWNHYDSLTRTNNRVEGFHSAIKRLLSSPHPNIYVLIDFLKQQQSCTVINYLRINQRIYSKQRPAKDTKNLLIELCKVEYNSTLNFEEFFPQSFETVNDDLAEALVESNVEKQTNSSELTYAQLETIESILQQTTSTGSSITITRGRLADFVKDIDDEIENDQFDYVKSGLNYDQVKEVFQRNKAQREYNEAAIKRRAVFSDEDLQEEVLKYWCLTNLKRKRIGQLDLEAARASLSKSYLVKSVWQHYYIMEIKQEGTREREK